MAEPLPRVWLARHGETAWSLSGQHTGRTDLPLTPKGEADARRLGDRLRGLDVDLVLTSPLQRATRTCALAGFAAAAEPDADLYEWDYGSYEGRRSVEIKAERPDWQLFRDGCPAGESSADVAARADRVVARARRANVNVLIFSSGHILRMVAARWLGLEPAAGARFVLDTASVSTLGYEHTLQQPVVRLWNEVLPAGT